MAAEVQVTPVTVSGFKLQSDGTFRAVIGKESNMGFAAPVRPIEGPFVPQVSNGSASIPIPKSAGIELARMSDEELGEYCLARQERLLTSLRRLESIRLSIGILTRRVSDARSKSLMTPDLDREVEDLRKGLLEEQASRKEEFRLLKPDLELGLLEQKRRGLATRDLPALLGESDAHQ